MSTKLSRLEVIVALINAGVMDYKVACLRNGKIKVSFQYIDKHTQYFIDGLERNNCWEIDSKSSLGQVINEMKIEQDYRNLLLQQDFAIITAKFPWFERLKQRIYNFVVMQKIPRTVL